MIGDEERRRNLRDILSDGMQIIGEGGGAAGGAALGFLLGGPAGAAAGEVVGLLSGRILSDVAERHLSRRERIRVGAVANDAIREIMAALDAGQTPREDGFFEERGNARSSAEEIFEGVLLKAKKQHEEKKIRYIAKIFPNIAFSLGISLGEANHILEIADSMSYEKMCLMSLIERKNQLQGITLRETDYHGTGLTTVDTFIALQYAFELIGGGLMLMRDETPTSVAVPLNFIQINPNKLELTPPGKRYYRIMGLNEIPEEEIRSLAHHLRPHSAANATR